MRWSEVLAAAGELAVTVQTRFDSVGLAMMATLRADGSPRISGIELSFERGQLWLGSMADARKGADLKRDGRLALHAATVDKQVTAGDAKLSGLARVADPDDWRAYLSAHTPPEPVETIPDGTPGSPAPFDLFWVDVTELCMVRVEVDHLVIESWRPGESIRRIERY